MSNSCIRLEADILQINRCKSRVHELSMNFNYMSNGLELASNEVRMKILFLLHEETRLCVCDLSDILSMTVSSISQHLRKMKDRRLIVFSREGQTIYYSLTEEYKNLLEPIFSMLQVNHNVEAI